MECSLDKWVLKNVIKTRKGSLAAAKRHSAKAEV